jgi:hypothetical protein
MLRYLHLQAGTLMSALSKTMLTTGAVQLVPGQEVPAAAAEVPDFVE